MGGLTAAAVLVLASVNTAYQRLFRPVYQGSFSLLITDPISDEGGARGNAAAASGTVFEQLARNTTQNDIPTLIEVLQSRCCSSRSRNASISPAAPWLGAFQSAPVASSAAKLKGCSR